MNLKFSINKEGKKIYTLKDKIDNKETQDAHYKFIKIRSVKTDKEDNN